MSAPATAAAAPPLYKGLYVPHLYALVVSTFFCGVIVDQFVNYIRPSPSKAPPRRFDNIIVSLLAAVRCVLFGLDMWAFYRLCYQHREYSFVYKWQISDFLTVLFVCFNTALGQVWFMERCWKVLKRSSVFLIIVIPIWLCSVSGGVSFFIVGMKTVGNPKYFKLRTKLVVTYAWSGCALDLINTAVLCYRVRQHKSINRKSSAGDVLVLAFTTGSLTSALALVLGAVYHKFWNVSNAFAPFLHALAAMSTISVLVTIAHRRTLQGRLLGMESNSDEAPRAPFQVSYSYNSAEASMSRPTNVIDRVARSASVAGMADEDVDYAVLAKEMARKRRHARRAGANRLTATNAHLNQTIDVASLTEWRNTTAAMATATGKTMMQVPSTDFISMPNLRPLPMSGLRKKTSAHTLNAVREGGSSPDSLDKSEFTATAAFDDDEKTGRPGCEKDFDGALPRPNVSRRGTSDRTMVNEDQAPTNEPQQQSRLQSRRPSAYLSEVGSAADLDRALASYLTSTMDDSERLWLAHHGGRAGAAGPVNSNHSSNHGAHHHHPRHHHDLQRSSIGISPRVVIVEDDARPRASASRRMSGIVVNTQVVVQKEE